MTEYGTPKSARASMCLLDLLWVSDWSPA